MSHEDIESGSRSEEKNPDADERVVAKAERSEEFRASLGDVPLDKQPLYTAIMMGLMGLVGWVIVDRTLSALHLAAWAGGGVVLGWLIGWSSIHEGLKAARISSDALVLEWLNGKVLLIRWREMQAARIDSYPHGIMILKIRVSGVDHKFDVSGFDGATELAFRAAVEGQTQLHGIPSLTADFRDGYQQGISASSAWTLLLGIMGIMGAYAGGYPTLGVLLGGAVVLTGMLLAMISLGERTSRRVLLAGVVFIAGLIGICYLFGISVKETLKGWETQERAEGKAPWKKR